MQQVRSSACRVGQVSGNSMKRKNALILFALLVVVFLIIDRVTKNMAIDLLTDSGPVLAIPYLFDFVLVYNTGAAFGMMEGGGWMFVGVAVVAVVAIIAYLIKGKELGLPLVLALSLIAGGALGNAYDRAVSGAVPDFIHALFIEFPVFNAADIFLTIGEIILIITVAIYWFGPQKTPALEEDAELGDATQLEEAAQKDTEKSSQDN